MRKRIYIAGPYSADNLIDYEAHKRIGRAMGAYLTAHGYAPYCPFLDSVYLEGVYGDAITVKDLQEVSMAYVETCEAMLILPGWENSKGTKAEIKRAKELNLPVYYDRDKFEKEMKP